MKGSQVYKAVVAAGGMGTRLAPLTSAIPKEMLPIGRKPMLHHVVDELRSAGIHEILFIVSPWKKSIIEGYFGNGLQWAMQFSYLIQEIPLGPGHAVLSAQSWVENEPFVVAWGDTLVHEVLGSGTEAPLKRMIQRMAAGDMEALVLGQLVSEREIETFERVMVPSFVQEREGGLVKIERVAEVNQHTVLIGGCIWVAGRWLLSPTVFDCFQQLPAGKEMYLLDAFEVFLSAGRKLAAVMLNEGESWHDIGRSWDSYFQAVLLGMKKEWPGFSSRT